MMRKSSGKWLALLIALGAITTSGCSTVGLDADKIKPLPASSLCPHPSVYASYTTFTNETRIKEGETAFQTVKRFRLAEKEKNAAGRRLWAGMKACRLPVDKARPSDDENALVSLMD